MNLFNLEQILLNSLETKSQIESKKVFNTHHLYLNTSKTCILKRMQ